MTFSSSSSSSLWTRTTAAESVYHNHHRKRREQARFFVREMTRKSRRQIRGRNRTTTHSALTYDEEEQKTEEEKEDNPTNDDDIAQQLHREALSVLQWHLVSRTVAKFCETTLGRQKCVSLALKNTREECEEEMRVTSGILKLLSRRRLRSGDGADDGVCVVVVKVDKKQTKRLWIFGRLFRRM